MDILQILMIRPMTMPPVHLVQKLWALVIYSVLYAKMCFTMTVKPCLRKMQ